MQPCSGGPKWNFGGWGRRSLCRKKNEGCGGGGEAKLVAMLITESDVD